MPGTMPMSDGPILVTGAAGFIGFHVARRLLENGRKVVGLDNLNAYYDPKLKDARRAELAKFDGFRFVKLDLADRAGMAALFAEHRFPFVVHLAAQAGVRYSLVDPHAYVDSNLVGLHQHSRRLPAQWLPAFAVCVLVLGLWLQYADAVFGPRQCRSSAQPLRCFEEGERVDGARLCAFVRLAGDGPAVFTVYGPWGRPDMAMWIFASAIMAGQPIKLFNHGNMRRDFTYIDDVVESVVRLVDRAPSGNPKWSSEAPGSRLKRGALARLQYRQQQSRRAVGGRASS